MLLFFSDDYLSVPTQKMTSPQYWGKHFWYTYHIAALGYPAYPSEEEKRAYKGFYDNFGKILPCKKCAVHYDEHMMDLPVNNALADSDSLFKWTVDVHNTVNKYLGKPAWPYQKALDYYKKGSYDSQHLDPLSQPFRLLLILIIVINIVIILYTMYLWKMMK
jgi:hypothetical protein